MAYATCIYGNHFKIRTESLGGKMNQPLISVIVPVYNVEEYLDRCVTSIVNQTYKNLEIILVDDGSPDHCPQMCDNWEKKDSRIKTIHKENGGLSSARNAGIKAMHGKYVCFIDSDDYMETEAVYTMYALLNSDNYDICVCNMKYLSKNGRLMYKGRCKDASISGKDVMKSFFEGNVFDPYSACNKLYKVSIIRENNLFFDETILWGEDFPFNYHFFKLVKKVVSTNDGLYNYIENRDGSITDGISCGKVNRWKTNYGCFFKEEKENPEYRTIISKKFAQELTNCCKELLCSNNSKLIDSSYPEMIFEIKKNFFEFITHKKIEPKTKLFILCIRICPRLLQKLFYLKCKKRHHAFFI